MWLDCDQNEQSWLDLRIGKIGGSSIGCIMANYGKGFGEPAKELAVNIACEEITGAREENGYSNSHMDRGHEQEPYAREEYEKQRSVLVTNGGYYDNGRTGCSPDGLVGKYGLVEIKSVIRSVHYKNITRGSYDPAYKWQYIFNLRESERDWIDTISYCHTFPGDKKLCVYRICKDEVQDEFKQIEARLIQFFALVDKIKSEIS